MKRIPDGGLRLSRLTVLPGTPLISITGVFGVKPAAPDAVLIVSATAADAASPTAPHFSQIRNTTGSLLS